jgi:predicted transcriptional regulator
MDERENILISVEHEFVARMLSGVKRIELRRRTLHIKPGTCVWIYSKAPRAAVAAVARVGSIVSARPAELWGKCRGLAGVTKGEFDAYFSNAPIGWAIFLEEICALPQAVTLAALRKHSGPFHPPQFFMRLHRGSGALDLLTSSFRQAQPRRSLSP